MDEPTTTLSEGDIMSRKQKILVVDDDQRIANLVRMYLEKAGYAVDMACDGAGAREKIKENPDLIILDLMLPDTSGLELCQKLRQDSDVPVIMLTAKVMEADRIEGFNRGADDYVTKPFSPWELVARVKAVLKRVRSDGLPAGPVKVEHGKFKVDFGKCEVQFYDTVMTLTPTEFRLLSAMIMEPNRVFSRGDLIDRAFGNDYESFERTLDVHILHLRRKLKQIEPAGSHCINTMYGMGYKLRVD
jgi:DNA-binding response OmpR family regulator